MIPTYDGWEQLGRCLTALEETLPEPFDGEVIVVDDGSGEETQALLDDWERSGSRLNLKVMRNSSNCGFTESCNVGAAAATGDMLVFLNDDTLPQLGWLSALLRTFRDHPDAGAVGGKLLYPGRQPAGGRQRRLPRRLGGQLRARRLPVGRPSVQLSARGGLLLRGTSGHAARALRARSADSTSRYRPAYYEDTDYCFAVRDSGRTVLYQPESVVVHTEGVTSGTDLSSGVKRYQVVNQSKFAEKWERQLREQPSPPDRYDLRVWYALATRGAGAVTDNGRVKHALVCAPLLPEFDREGGSRRIFHLLELLREDGWTVSYVAENPHGDERYVRMLAADGHRRVPRLRLHARTACFGSGTSTWRSSRSGTSRRIRSGASAGSPGRPRSSWT